MNPRPITDADIGYWGERAIGRAVYTAPGEVEEGIQPCPALNLTEQEIAVPWQLDEIELAHLARGGTLWLVCRGLLPVHGLHVQERS